MSSFFSDQLITTVGIAFVLFALAVAALALGWFLTGKSKIVRGACGMDPKKLPKEGCGKDVKCDLCDSSKKDNHKKNQ